MPSQAITEHPERGAWKAPRETAPSVMRADEPTFARVIGMIGLMALVLGGMALYLILVHKRANPFIGVNGGSLLVVIGLGGLLFHAACDRDLQIRRTYGVFGLAWLAFSLLMTALPIGGRSGTQFLPWGLIGLTLCLLFMLPFLRNESEPAWRNAGAYLLGLVGLAFALTGFIGGNISENFLVPYGALLAALGFLYWWAFVGVEGTSSGLGYRAGLGLGILGLMVFLVALGRSILPPLFYRWGWTSAPPESYFVPSGLTLMVLGLAYMALAAGVCLDNRLVVLTRRELAAFFYSPIAYIVLVGLTLLGLWNFYLFVDFLFSASREFGSARLQEPVIQRYVISFWPFIAVIFVVPVLTMRLLSEEQRTGTLEVLLTAPVGEVPVVLGKFLATFIFFLLAWVPWGLYLVALRVVGGQPFEYHPLLTFFIALACSGAAFLSMGQFFSSLTRNQIAAALITFVGMIGLVAIGVLKGSIENPELRKVWEPILGQASFLDLWIESMDGQLVPRYLIFQVTLAVFWLFLTVKVLESRKWR